MAGVAVAACFFPWVSVPGKDVVVGGFSATVSDYGKPGIITCFFTALCVIFILLGRVWSVRAAFFLSALVFAWAARNFFMLSTCQGGICPEKHTALYIELLASFLLIPAILFVKPSGKAQRVISKGIS